jgi:tripartite-type tricarboxylate transporter receptor subunit TctC
MSARPLVSAALAAVCLASLAPSTLAQQKFPSRPIRVIVPYTPGGLTDVTTRMVMLDLVKNINQNVIIDNRPGGNSIVGVDTVSKANADGYTLASVIAAHAANQTLYPKLPYDSIKSFSPVSLLVTAPLILCVTNALAARDAKELIALAKAKPGQLTFASSGIGAAAHLTTELLMLNTGTKMIHVPYKGTAPALLDLTSGQVSFMFDTPISMLPQVRAGKFRALAMASEKRVSSAPELPTLVELGIPVIGGSWVGILAPARTPPEIVSYLGRELTKVVQQKELRERFVQMGNDPAGLGPEEFTQFLRDEVAKWGKVIRDANVKIDG